MDDASLSKMRGIGFLLLNSAIVAVAAIGCSTYIGTTSKSFLRQARENPDPNIRYIAYAKLGVPAAYENQAQKDEAIQSHDRQAARSQGARRCSRGHRPQPRAIWVIAVHGRRSSRQPMMSRTP